MPHAPGRFLRPVLCLLLVWLLLLSAAPGSPAPVAAQSPAVPPGAPGGAAAAPELPPDEPLPEDAGGPGRHYRQAGEGTGDGFDVVAPFFDGLEALGGVDVAGYPVSVPFGAPDGCAYQTFQVLLLQACPDLPLRPANTFEILAAAGADGRLAALGIGPGQTDGATTFDAALGVRLTWLEDAPIREYFASRCGDGDVAAAVQRCGLPMAPPRPAGPFVSQRFQRIAFQRWLVDGPAGIDAGDVTAVLGGDLLKALGVLRGVAVRPHPPGRAPAVGVLDFAALPPPAPPAAPAPGAAPGTAPFAARATLGLLQPVVLTAPAAAPADFRAALPGQDVSVGDAVRTDATGRALLTFFEGTTVEVLPDSLLLVERLDPLPPNGPAISLRQTIGQVLHRVATALTPATAYEVRTPSATIVVRGTVFRVTVDAAGATRVEVFSGTVEVSGAGGTVVVPAGAASDVLPGQQPTAPAPNAAPPPPAAAPESVPGGGSVPPAGPTPPAAPPAAATPAGVATPGGTPAPLPSGATPDRPAATPSTAPAPAPAGTAAPTASPTGTAAPPTPAGPQCPGVGPLPAPAAGRVTICHRVSPLTDAHVVVEVPEAELGAYLALGDTIYRR